MDGGGSTVGELKCLVVYEGVEIVAPGAANFHKNGGGQQAL